MAKITITIEDQGFGELVKVEVRPPFKEMATIMREGRGLTAAHRVAMFALQAMKRAAVNPEIKNSVDKLILPS